MKKIILVLSVFFSLNFYFSEKAFAGSLQEVLMRNNTSLAQLQQSGRMMSDGEFTGAGKKIPLKSIQVFITADDVILGQDVSAFVSKEQSNVVSTLADLSALHWQGMLVEINQIKAIIISK